MGRLRQRVTQRWSGLGLAARMWWVALTTVGIAAVLVLSATSVVDATSHPSPSPASPAPAAAATPTGAAPTASAVCPSVKGATTMSDGMVMAPVPPGPPTAAQRAAADELVAQTEATLTKFTSLS